MSKQFKKRRKLKQRKIHRNRVGVLLEAVRVGDIKIMSAKQISTKKVSVRYTDNSNHWGWSRMSIPTKVSEPDQLMLVEAYPLIGKFLKLTPKALQLYNMLEIL